MKILMASVTLVVMSVAVGVSAQAQGISKFPGKCGGTLEVRTGPNGRQTEICLNGSLSTCKRDAVRLGWAPQQANTFCDGRRAQGRLRKP
jgi:hypothetical protein